MKKYDTFIPSTFNQEELDKRIASAHTRYNNTILLEAADIATFLRDLKEKESAGYKIDWSYLPLLIPTQSGFAIIHARLLKPATLVKKELAAITEQVTAEYTSHLEAEKLRAVDAMTNRLIGEAEAKKAKARTQEAEETRAEARAEAMRILNIQESD
ncbi:hypothetical protein SAMN05216206_2583 [Pseudomonas guineae]|uniref:Uncharacterized protein n=1 Tax=Pseudomonas guineae TaxID=425504 RepID=A0A1I3JR16_9PSED|nr:hypothetical protein [Pseudomonas guineae]SFI62702.1 hypothetical protein SAMN05216206_2583 [Pseudomonas guineae]